MRKLHLATIFFSIVFATVMAISFVFVSLPVAEPLKQNVYIRTFTDSRHLVSLDVIVYYETEPDGTWLTGYHGYKDYNITVLVKPTFINTTAVSMLRVLQCFVGAPLQLLTSSHPECPIYMPVDQTPLDVGVDLIPYGTNNATWLAASEKERPAIVNIKPISPSLENAPLHYHFVLRSILTDGTREIFTADDIIEIPISVHIK